MKVLDDGHIYRLEQLDTDKSFDLKFVKRSSSTVHHPEEWGGLQSQEVLRALIHRTIYLGELVPCIETSDTVYHLRQALYMYEVRAYKRKMQSKNRKGEHDDNESPKGWRESPFEVPFLPHIIEQYPIGSDGHIITDGL